MEGEKLSGKFMAVRRREMERKRKREKKVSPVPSHVLHGRAVEFYLALLFFLVPPAASGRVRWVSRRGESLPRFYCRAFNDFQWLLGLECVFLCSVLCRSRRRGTLTFGDTKLDADKRLWSAKGSEDIA